MAIHLTDDGTLDTVLRCDECGEEFRYNYDLGLDDPDGLPTDYDAFIEWAIEDATAEHYDCSADTSRHDREDA